MSQSRMTTNRPGLMTCFFAIHEAFILKREAQFIWPEGMRTIEQEWREARDEAAAERDPTIMAVRMRETLIRAKYRST